MLVVVSTTVFLALFEFAVSLFWYSETYGDTCMEDHLEMGYVHRKNCVSKIKQPEGEMVEYKYNACGFRNDNFECWPEREKIVVLSIGDSFSEGAMVNENEMYTKVAEKILRSNGHDIVYVNAGVSGYDLLQYYQITNILLQQYRPDVVLIGLLPNDLLGEIDLSEIEKRKKLYSQTSRQDSYAKINLRTEDRLNLFYKIKKIITGTYTGHLITHGLLRIDSIYYTAYLAKSDKGSYLDRKYSEIWNSKLIDAGTILNRINERAKSVDAKFMVVAIPQRIQALLVSGKYEVKDKNAHELVKKLRKITSESGFPITDFLDDLDGVSNATEYYYVVDGHLTPEGHALLGQHVAINLNQILNDK